MPDGTRNRVEKMVFVATGKDDQKENEKNLLSNNSLDYQESIDELRATYKESKGYKPTEINQQLDKNKKRISRKTSAKKKDGYEKSVGHFKAY